MPDLRAVDFSTYYVKTVAAGGYVTPESAAAFVQSGVDLPIIGYDSGADSLRVQQMIMAAGCSIWDAYRFLYRSGDPIAQMTDVIRAIQATPPPLPGYLHMDIEPIWSPDGSKIIAPPPSIAQVEAAADFVYQQGIAPGALVQPSCYTSKYVWDNFYVGYTGLKDRGWKVWVADWPGLGAVLQIVHLFGGWDQLDVIGHQYAGTRSSPIGGVDDSIFAARTAAQPQPPPQSSEDTRLRAAMAWRLSGAASLLRQTADVLDPATPVPEDA